ncbi:hypothetical protein JDV02_000891 [Purpureocillium takamizusanense]|uniref:YDG domain-containing protein n=1 Tax=Purpureocillium takamizusanense TaxID=2060973 RepID=A0A9Q8Q8B1_9HYPO|nr:uncharacterized protein JDV02_000891 [Purpureocillium takamizusanense]UNI14242.1 hypothetical protein JDV02_000891 [Purpureocillium takamizusanense]
MIDPGSSQVSSRRRRNHRYGNSRDTDTSGDASQCKSCPEEKDRICSLTQVGMTSGDVSPKSPCVTRGLGLTEAALFELCDIVRAGLVGDNSPPETATESITTFLEAAAIDEMCSIPTIPLGTIRKTRLDKLLIDILSPENHIDAGPSYPWTHVETAQRLQRQWRARFRERFFDLDQSRYRALSKTGALRGVTFCNVVEPDGDLWQAAACNSLSEGEGNPQYEPGSDGIVDSTVERVTKGPQGVTALPLLSGSERLCSPFGSVKYAREGKLSEMHLCLISQVGKQIRILRGHRLRSPLAPRAGVRYDGWYIICQYGQKFNEETGLSRVEITLERASGQRPFDDVAKVPRPSQLDDWHLYEKYEGEIIRQRRGEQGFLDWKRAKAEETMDLEQWRQALELGKDLKLAKPSRSTRSMVGN